MAQAARYGGGRRVTVAKSSAAGALSKPKADEARSAPASRARPASGWAGRIPQIS